MTAELVHVAGAVDLRYRLSGLTHYIALHDMTMQDGETCLDGAKPVRMLDLRDRITFLPRGCGISGWSSLSKRQHSFVALHYKTDLVEEEFEMRIPNAERPDVYFNDRPLRSTLRKMQSTLAHPEAGNDIYVETLAVLAVIETHRHALRGDHLLPTESGCLSHGQERLIRDYVTENLSRRISLGDLATLSGLSRFHFARAFKSTFGTTPHRFVTLCRVQRAKHLLGNSSLPVGAVGHQVGFTNAVQFATVFRKFTGIAPLRYRREQP
jgi:AraC family transcriptional regulator